MGGEERDSHMKRMEVLVVPLGKGNKNVVLLSLRVFFSGLSGLGLSPGRGHCVVFLGKTLYSHSTSLYSGV